MTRWKAAAIHSSISAGIALLIGALLFGVWYPPPYFHAAGADELILLLVGVDLAVGPLLTLIVFRSGKRGLKFDLATIGILQTAALIYGLHIVLQSRPVFLVGVVDRFVLVSASDIADEDLAQGIDNRFRSRSWTGPRLVGVELPKDTKELDRALSSALRDGKDMQVLPKYYRDFPATSTTLLVNAKTLDALRTKHPESDPLITGWLAKHQRAATSVVWVPIEARKADLVMLIDSASAQPLQALPLDPW